MKTISARVLDTLTDGDLSEYGQIKRIGQIGSNLAIETTCGTVLVVGGDVVTRYVGTLEQVDELFSEGFLEGDLNPEAGMLIWPDSQ